MSHAAPLFAIRLSQIFSGWLNYIFMCVSSVFRQYFMFNERHQLYEGSITLVGAFVYGPTPRRKILSYLIICGT